MDENEALQTVLDTLDKEEAAQAPQEKQIQEGAPETASAETEAESQAEPAEQPAIEPPSTWKAELKDRWTKLPADLQRDLAQWETERNSGVNQRLEKATAAEKAAEQERLRFAQTLDSVIQQAVALDPVLAITTKMAAQDWTRMWAENPSQAGILKAQHEERLATINGWAQQSQLAKQQQAKAMETEASQRLGDILPEWKDEAKRSELKQSITKSLQEDYGFRPEEISMVLDPRHVIVARDAMLWRQHLAAQKTVQEKKVSAPAKPTIKPTATVGNQNQSDRFKALKQRALRTGKDDDVMAALMAAQT